MTFVSWILFGCGLLVALATIPSVYFDLCKVLHEPESLGLDDRLTNLNPDEAGWLTEWKGGRWGRYGWYLPRAETGKLRITLPGSAPGTLKLRVWAVEPGRISATLVDETGVRFISADQLDGRVLSYRVAGPGELQIVATNELEWEQLVLDRLAVVWWPAKERLPLFWPAGFALIFWLAGWGCRLNSRTTAGAWSLLLGSASILAAAVWGFHLRWDLFEMARFLPPDLDVVGTYMPMARSFRWFSADFGFYSGAFGPREPLYLILLNWWFQLWGDTYPAIKWYTVCASTGLIVAIGMFVWALSRLLWGGVLAAWIAAVNPALIDESVRGMRIETESLLFLAVVSLWLWGRGWAGAILIGAGIGLTSVLRTAAFSVFVPMIWLGWFLNGWCAWKGGGRVAPSQWRWPHLVLASLVALAIYGPYLHSIYKVYGDPSWSVNFQARWNANVEFSNRLGSPGFPSQEEFRQNPYSGPPITYTHYLFGLHSVPTLLYGQLKGWVESTLYMGASATPNLKPLIFLLHASGLRAVPGHLSLLTACTFVASVILMVLGWVVLWREPNLWWVPMLSLWGTWYAGYMYHARLIEPFRQTGHVYPLLLFCQLWGMIWVMRRWRNSSLRSSATPDHDSA